jgi:NitT/TauT family transport system substrate-binding protein
MAGGVTAATLIASMAACGSSAGPIVPGLTPVTIAMGYFPNIQFAPYYVAQAKGYYRRVGLKVTFQSGIEPDVIALLSSGKAQFALASGDEVLSSGAQGRTVRTVMTQFSRFPLAVFSLKGSGITSAAQLRGKTIGVPGQYGASYIGLLALLQAAGVQQKDVTVKTIGFTQAQTLSAHKVQSVVGYANNDVVQLTARGTAVHEIDVYHYANLAAAGVVANDSEIGKDPGMVRAFVRATLHGLRETIAHPAEAYRISAGQVPEIKAQPAVQHAVLARSIDFWRAEPGHPLGWIDPAIWQRTERVLYRFGQISRQVKPSDFYTNQFISGTG